MVNLHFHAAAVHRSAAQSHIDAALRAGNRDQFNYATKLSGDAIAASIAAITTTCFNVADGVEVNPTLATNEGLAHDDLHSLIKFLCGKLLMDHEAISAYHHNIAASHEAAATS